MKYFSLLYQGDVHTATDEKVIPADQFSLLLDAAEVLEKAKEDARTYKEETEAECETLRQQARQEGFAEGLSQFNEHLINFEQNLRKLRHDTQQATLPLALQAAKKIVGKQLDLHPETIVDIVLQAILPMTQSHRVTIYVNKSEKEILEAQKPRIKEILEQIESLSIQDRSDVSPGGCIIETERGIINATIENQWRALEAAFQKYMKRQI